MFFWRKKKKRSNVYNFVKTMPKKSCIWHSMHTRQHITLQLLDPTSLIPSYIQTE